MNMRPIQMTDVIYNAAEQCFEAIVTIHDGDCARNYACSINAPISTSFADAASGLRTQAERRHAGHGGLYSQTQLEAASQRAGRQRFDPKLWLAHVVALPGLRAA